MSHVIPLKSVLLGMNEEGFGAFTWDKHPVTSVFRSRGGGGRKRESGVGAVFNTGDYSVY